MRFRCPALALLFCSVAFAAPPNEYSRRIWRSDDGLPQNKIQVISQTPEGYLWIGTSGGLVRFDGVRFVVFDRSNTPALREDSILSLCPGYDGSLWIGTEGGGLVRMKSGAFELYGAPEGLTNGFVRALMEDRSHILWVGSDRGFFRLQNGRMIRLDARGDTPILGTRSIYQDRSGQIWVGTHRGLFSVDGALMRHADPEYHGIGYVDSMVETADGSFWFAAEASLNHVVGGKLRLDPALARLSARSLFEDHEGNLWIGSLGEGLTRFRDGIATHYSSNGILPDNSVSCIFEDREQSLWVGTQDGLLRLSRTAVRTITTKDGLADDNVATVYEDPARALWIGTASGQLYRQERAGLTLFEPPVSSTRLRAQSIFQDSRGVRWVGSARQGVLRIEGAHSRLFTTQDGLRSNDIRDFLEDRTGAIWIATGSGLSRWDGHSIRTYYLEDGLAYGSVRVLALDRNGDILVGTEGGINRVRGSAFVRDPVFAKLGNERVWTILPDSGGSLWLGTRGNGLVRIRDGTISRFTTRDGLLSNSIYQILDDGQGRFWIGCSAGVFAADRKEFDAVADGRSTPIAIVPYGTDEGLPSSQMSGGVQPAGCRTAAGRFWFPSVKGAVQIDPSQLRTPPSSPVLIESVIADDKQLPMASQLSVPAGRGKLEIDFTSPNLLSPGRVTFAYRLEGFDDSWTSSTGRRAAYYTNLPPGSYRFHVIARDGAQRGHASEATLPFVLRPHFYEAIWFYCLLTVLFALLAWSIFRFYARQTRDRYALVLAERTRLAREMHDTVIQGCVGASTLLEAARSLPPGAGAKTGELLERAANQMRLTVNEAREAVWDLRHSTIEHGLTGTLQDFARQVTAAEGIPVRADIEGTPATLEDLAGRNLLLVAREAIRNAVTHARPGKIDVVLRFEPAEVRLEVNDDGRGFSPENARENGHYGITGMRERVEQSGGRFELRSSPGHGTSVVARLPFKVKHGPNGAHSE